MAKLWDYYDGEPFMENPHLAIIGNPFKVGSIIERKKQGFRKISERKGSKVMAYKRRRGKKNSPRRRRRNPIPGGGLMLNRPRRRRRNRVYHMRRNRKGTYVHNRRRRRSNPGRRRRRNPVLLGVALPPINMIAWGAGGFIATPMVESYLTKFLPAEIMSNTLGRYAVKIGTVLGLTYLVKHILSPKEAFPVALGGSMYVVNSAVNEFLPQILPPPPPPPPPVPPQVRAYRSGMIKAYRSGMIATGIGNYAATNLAGPVPGLAQPSQMMQRFDIDSSGMKNPVFADPRFVNSPMVAR